MSEPIEIVFEFSGRSAQARAEAGTPLFIAAEAAGVPLNVACGGTGACGGCAVDLVAGRFAGADGEAIQLSRPHRVLACRTRLLGGPARVRVPRHSLISAGERVVIEFDHVLPHAAEPSVRKVHLALPQPSLHDQRGDVERILESLAEAGHAPVAATLPAVRETAPACRDGGYRVTATLAAAGPDGWRLVRVEPGDGGSRCFGLAVDIGTTTVVCSLVDLAAGRLVDSASSYNQQVRRCDDVASRIVQGSTPQGLAEMQRLVVEATMNRLVGLLLDRHALLREDLVRVAVAGNSVMTHLLLRADPRSLGGVPFQPAVADPPCFAAAELGLAAHPAAPVDVAPATAAYVGGDITADMHVCGIAESDELTLLVDIGTNAEIVAGDRERLVACAAPAGPAFEGHGLRCGMRASSGAIDRVAIDPASGACRYGVIDGGAPSGICGSGLIDVLGQAFRAGLLTAAGRFDPERVTGAAAGHFARVATADGRELLAYVLAPADQTEDGVAPVVVTEADVAALLQAKGVVFAAMQMAIQRLGRRFDEVRRVFLAGGFARHLNLANCVTAGLLPDLPHERFRFIGNGSLAGAVAMLVDRTARHRMLSATRRPEVVELNLDPAFADAYTMAMLLPNGDPELFPSVR